MAKVEPKFVQIIAAPWGDEHGTTSSIYALGANGKVYRFLKREDCWEELSMDLGEARRG